MQVETYECQETASEPIEASEEAIRIITELGLEGQQELLTPVRENKPVGRNPYPEANAEQIFVFRVLCPKSYTVKKYNRTPIPLRVLQVAAHAISLEMFKEVVVWDATDPAEKDPVLVGTMKNPARSWDDKFFLLARWGDVLESWPILLKRALEKKRHQVQSAAEAVLLKAKSIVNEGVCQSDDELITNGFDWMPDFRSR